MDFIIWYGIAAVVATIVWVAVDVIMGWGN